MKRMVREFEVYSDWAISGDLTSELSHFLKTEFNPTFTLESYENETGESVNVSVESFHFDEYHSESDLTVYFNREPISMSVKLQVIENDKWFRLVGVYGKGQQKQTTLILNRIEESLSKFTY